MSWEQRLREMLLAGGALAATACSSSQSSGSSLDAGGHDATSDAAHDTGLDTGNDTSAVGSSGCCNANDDPCCDYLYCDAAISAQCTEEMACQADGGVWTVYPPSCSLGEGSAPSDGGADH